ncbi:hypothetical protein ACSBR1_004415 [Camellia fascicularis]
MRRPAPLLSAVASNGGEGEITEEEVLKREASDILIKHQGSRCKAFWKNPEGQIIMNTTKDIAISQPKSLRDDIVSGKSKFDNVTSHYSNYNSVN